MKQYRENLAEKSSWDRAHRPKTCKLVEKLSLARIEAIKLQLERSTKQIA